MAEHLNRTTLLTSPIPQNSRQRAQQFMEKLQDEICTAFLVTITSS